MTDLQSWVGREVTIRDELTAFPARALGATLNRKDLAFEAGSELPPLWHWLYALDLFSLDDAGYDGHASTGSFLPPVPLPRRMWAGGRLKFHVPLRVGQRITKRSVVKSVAEKAGRSGQLVFVTVRHEIFEDTVLYVEEEHDIVYRARPTAAGQNLRKSPKIIETGPQSRSFKADPVLLFRYSALTFNGHRIHYDRNFCTEMEGYDGLVVHGPLLATLLLDHLDRTAPGKQISAFEFRALAPVFDLDGFSLNSNSLDQIDGNRLWVRRDDGVHAMDATVDFAIGP